MTYFITALTNDKARLIVSETQTTCGQVAAAVERIYRSQGYIVVGRTEK